MKKAARKHKKNRALQNRKVVRKWMIPALTTLFVVILGTIALVLKLNSPKNKEVATNQPTVEIVNSEDIPLPKPDTRSNNSLESVLNTRRSKRDFFNENISLKAVSQMLWAAQGVTSDWGGRTVPSAKSTYPLTVYLIVNKVEGLDPGEYEYIPGDRTPVHAIRPIKKVELQKALYEQLNQSSFKDAPAVIVVTGNMKKMSEAFGGTQRNESVYLEAGHCAQNLYLQAESLKLGMVVVDSFNESQIRQLITLPDTEKLIYLVPFGSPKE